MTEIRSFCYTCDKVTLSLSMTISKAKDGMQTEIKCGVCKNTVCIWSPHDRFLIDKKDLKQE